MSLTKKFPQNIEPALLKAWQKARRKGDPEALAKALLVSRPIIDRALIYGHVKEFELSEKITAFFEERAKADKEAQKAAAKRLSALD